MSPSLQKRHDNRSRTLKRELILPANAPHLNGESVYIEKPEQLKEWLNAIRQQPITAVAIDFEFGYTKEALVSPKGSKEDIRSIKPLLLSLTVISDRYLATAVLNLIAGIPSDLLQPLFNFNVPYIAHHAKAELHCIWQLGIREPRYWWDTLIAERALYLGLYQRATEEQDKLRFGLVDVAKRYGIEHAFCVSKAELQASFLTSDITNFTPEQIAYAGEDAIVTAQLFFSQKQRSLLAGIEHHLTAIEMPWVITNASMEWHGVLVDRSACDLILEKASPKLENLRLQLQDMGLQNPNSSYQQRDFFKARGLLDCFRKRGKYCFDKEMLKEMQHRDKSIALLAEFKKVQAMLKEPLLQSHITGADGRVHPTHNQLQVVTGRQSTVKPNLLGLPGIARPVICAPEGYGIGEADYAQIEIAITAAVYQDQNLIDKFNQGDIYTAMAPDFFIAELPPEHQQLSAEEFKQKHKDKRNIMKQCTLGIIYGLSAFGLARRLNISEHQAQQLMDKFLSMFTSLKHAMDVEPQYGYLRGYVSTATGLNRYKAVASTPDGCQKWMVNMPVQGTAAALFKRAGNRLYQHYKAYDARLILAVHDAFVFEAPNHNLEEVARLTEQIMIDTICEFFPQLKPRVDLNYSARKCWTKDGDSRSLENWLKQR